MRGRRVYALIGDALDNDIEHAFPGHVLLSHRSVPYERSDEVRGKIEGASMVDEFMRYTNEEAVELQERRMRLRVSGTRSI